ncbi:tetratricopeptide repeat protein [Marivibrio halodurans]|uniref:Tetratricopeptide repeat protein n=1 Tax=Marivibrio halodurans TaxID=2039722 RepID=A0A8J7SI23_9PROT|nr:tetratricopeptide repeat protein [Marivibrio halodurans]
MSDIFTEVDEDLRRERAKALWKRYGRYVVAVAVIAILAVGAHTWWRSYEQSQQLEMADRYTAALAGGGESAPAETAARLEEFAGTAGEGYRLIALLRAAGFYGEAGEHRAAADIYGAIAADQSVETLYRDLATILGAGQAAQTEGADAAALLEEVAPHTVEGTPWRFIALEVAAGLALQAGKPDRAREFLGTIADNQEASQQSRSRAGEILRAVGE